MESLEDRVDKLERLVADLGQVVLDRGKEIERLKGDLSWEQTQRSIAEM
jgi:hypothetical protein